ncbi:MAG: HAMP domain-containing histidine kinase [Proteobacteria bacterium]|nr:MAG: HAMP domain-containing histidine kinase [Pseudomonadota bacterium]
MCQAALPDLADACFTELLVSSDDSRAVRTAFRFPEESSQYREHSADSSLKLRVFFRELPLVTQDPRRLTDEELTLLRAFLSIPVQSAAIAASGSVGEPIAYMLFVMTTSAREFDDERLQMISDLASLSERLVRRARSEETLKHEVSARDRLISIASHELKTPLTSLKLMLDRMRRELNTGNGAFTSKERMDQTFVTIDRTIMRLAQSVSMLFNLSELQSGRISILKEPCQLSMLLRDVCTRMDGLMNASGCKLKLETPDDIEGFFDPRRIEQAIVNLLANAAKHAPRSQVSVTLEASHDTQIKIWVSDDGPGIPLEHHSRIFEAFGRSSESNNIEGLGLGLFIASGVIRAHGGRLTLDSEPNEGARFLIEIPRWQA